MSRLRRGEPASAEKRTPENQIIEALREASPQPLGLRELVRRLGPRGASRTEVRETTRRLAEKGTIRQARGRKYVIPHAAAQRTGTFHSRPEGYGFVVLEGPRQEELFIRRDATQGAMHGDRVLVEILPRRKRRRATSQESRREGRIVGVLERVCPRVAGWFQHAGRRAFVVPSDPRLCREIEVIRGEEGTAKNGQIVIAEIRRFPMAAENPWGAVVEVLGYPEDEGVEVELIIRKHELATEFPKGVIAGSERAAMRMTEEEVARRLDLRDQTVVTIDGEDARDFDDAVSIEPIKGGGYRLGVHIADVGFFVPEGSALDREALGRGTSVYFPRRVLPMLPPALSTGACSLNPGEDRLAVSVIMDFGPSGEPGGYRMHDTVIRSAARLTYTEVARVLRAKTTGELGRELRATLRMMGRLSQILRKRRLAEESLDLDIPEAEVLHSKEGKVEDVRRAPRTAAHMLIEEFMLAANRTVATHLSDLGLPCMWRIHEHPDADAMREFQSFARSLGCKAAKPAGMKASTLQRLLEDVRGTDVEPAIHIALLRSMKRARYSARNAGHFALGFQNYVHFTSPIRRYPDLVVHRLLRRLRSGGVQAFGNVEQLGRELERTAAHCSERQRAAEHAEREVVDLCRARVMLDKIGERYDGRIIGVTSFGFFVELNAPFVEGLVPVSSLADDRYEFVENRQTLVGKRTGRSFRIGDKVTVEVANVSVERRQIEFRLVGDEPHGAGATRRRRRRPSH